MGVVLATLGVLALTSCSSGSTFTQAPADKTPQNATAPSATVPPDSKAQAVVREVGLVASDLAVDGQVDLLPGGDQVEGQVTLDGCGYDFTTESLRVARRQVWIDSPGDDNASYSNEVVAYETPAAARLAFGQYKESALKCPPDAYMPSTVSGVPPLRSQLLSSVFNPSWLPVAPSIGTLQRVTTESGEVAYAAYLFQQHGVILDAHYLLTLKMPTKAQRAELISQAKATGTRLAALPAR